MSRNKILFSLYAVVISLFLFIFNSSPYYVTAATSGSPTSPTHVKAIAHIVSAPQVVISWDQAMDDIGVTRYNIYKNGTFLVSPKGVGVTYTDYAIAAGQSYTYAIQAGDGDGNNSPQSDTVTLTVIDGAVSHITAPPQTGDTSEVPINIPQATVYSSASYDTQSSALTPPDTVGLSSFNKELHITWKNSKNSTWKSVRVIKKINAYPTGVTDGTIICDTSNYECIDREVASKITYYYGVYAVDQSFATSKLVSLSGSLVEEVKAVVASSSLFVTQKTTHTSEVVPQTTLGATTSISSFTKTLKLGSVGAEVLLLQKFLNAHGFLIATTGPGSAGNETVRFGLATEKALKVYQCSKKIVCDGTPSATGYGMVGKTTRGYLNKKE